MFFSIMNGPKEGFRYAMTPGILRIGRSEEAEISLPGDQYISGLHAELRSDEQARLYIRDLGSKNGTYLNGELVREATLVDYGSIIQTGRTFFKFSRRAAERYQIQDPNVSKTPEAILVIDIVGSSRIAQAVGDRVASKVKDVLLGKLNDRLALYPADYLKNTGDGFLLIFSNVKHALKLASELLDDLRKDDSSRAIHVRMGVHFGETTVLPDGDRRGMAVDMAFRVESVKIDDMHQTVVGIKKDMLPRIDRLFITEVVQKMIAADPMVRSRCIGYFDLKGFTGRHKIYEVVV